mgnify:CR=1 FL=1
MIVARLEGTKDISDILEKLEGLEYETSSSNKKIGYVFRKNASSSDLSRDVKSVKTACKFTGSIKCTHGSNSTTY